MSILKEFDKALVGEETKTAEVKSGYFARNNPKQYTEYLDNASWEEMLSRMSENHKKQYGTGGGKELEEKNGKPPKMAAFASSSRMIYNLSKDTPDFVFEKNWLRQWAVWPIWTVIWHCPINIFSWKPNAGSLTVTKQSRPSSRITGTAMPI